MISLQNAIRNHLINLTLLRKGDRDMNADEIRDLRRKAIAIKERKRKQEIEVHTNNLNKEAITFFDSSMKEEIEKGVREHLLTTGFYYKIPESRRISMLHPEKYNLLY